MSKLKIPLIIRGRVIEDYEIEYEGKGGARGFVTPDIHKYGNELVNTEPSSLLDLYDISFQEILDYLCRLGERLDLDTNPYWRDAYEEGRSVSNLSDAVLEHAYRNSGRYFSEAVMNEIVERQFGGRQYFESWVPTRLLDGRTLSVRAFGARAVHVIAGNLPGVAFGTVMRTALTRSDSIIKLPSNDPLTAIAIARTMIEMAPDHPLTRHLSVAYWKGGDEQIEKHIYQPGHVEKIVAWGGFDSIKHITKYLQPGIDLITLDPKSSTSLIGREAFSDDATLREVAKRAAVDMGGLDQEACLNARVMYLESGTDAAGIERANQFGKYMFEELQRLPSIVSNGPKRFDPVLKSEIKSILDMTDWYKVYVDRDNIDKGAVIVSQFGKPVDFSALLYGRVGNIVPVEKIDDAIGAFTAYTQTVGIYPDSLKNRIRDRAALSGGQMLISLGYATRPAISGPQDGIEPMRRMCKWIVDCSCDPSVTPGPWVRPGQQS